MSRALLIFFLLSGSNSAFAEPRPAYRPRASGFDAKQRKLLTPTLTNVERERRIGFVRRFDSSGSYSGYPVERRLDDEQRKQLGEIRTDALTRLTELDPKHELLSKSDWTDIRDHHVLSFRQLTNKHENLEFLLEDEAIHTAQIVRYEQVALGRLAHTLATALSHEAPSPERLQSVMHQLAEQHPFLASPFKVEMLIADMRRVQPTLAKWDFREMDDGRRFRGDRVLPPSTQATITNIGHRAFTGANVLFANHMYSDSLAMVDALTALGLEPENARFVATPYPFDKRVRALLVHRGVEVEASPYSVEETKKMVGNAVEALLVKARANHGPIVVYDDGGMATEYIAKNHKDELHRFRIIEITKAGERIGKTVLPAALGVKVSDHGAVFDRNDLDALRSKFIEIRTIDEATAKQAAFAWDQQIHSRPNMYQPQNKERMVPASSFGFAYYTYSNTKYKRDVMTPLYTEQVNSSLFESIARGGHAIANKRVTIVGGGAMGISAARELRTSGYEVTFVEPDAERVKVLASEQFKVEPLESALPGRGIVLEMSGMKNIIGVEQLHLLDDGSFLAHGSSKDNPIDMERFRALAKSRTEWPEHNGQRSASYTFKAAGVTKTIHMPGDGFTISHGGKVQNVPLEKFAPELDRLVNLGVYALENKPVTYYPIFTAPEHAMDPSAAE